MKREAYVELLAEAREGDDPKRCGLLRSCLNGMRDVWHDFEEMLAKRLIGPGCQRGGFSAV
eukprot:8769459-Prorocentrum_lima.AAC.1